MVTTQAISQLLVESIPKVQLKVSIQTMKNMCRGLRFIGALVTLPWVNLRVEAILNLPSYLMESWTAAMYLLLTSHLPDSWISSQSSAEFLGVRSTKIESSIFSFHKFYVWPDRKPAPSSVWMQVQDPQLCLPPVPP